MAKGHKEVEEKEVPESVPLKYQQLVSSRGIIAMRKGIKGRVYNVSIHSPASLKVANFGKATARVEVFVPDSTTYKPVRVTPPITFRGLQHLKGQWVPGQYTETNKAFWFYPPILEGQTVLDEDRERAEMATADIKNWVYWEEDGSRWQVTVPSGGGSFPFTSRMQEPRTLQQPMKVPSVPKFEPLRKPQPFDPTKEVIDAKPGYRFDIYFPEYRENVDGKEYIIKPKPLEKYWIPFSETYEPVMVQPVKTVGHPVGWRKKRWRPNLSKVFENKTYRFWPPRVPGQHIKPEYRQRVERANKSFMAEDVDTPLPNYVDPNFPVTRIDAKGVIRGYDYIVRYPPWEMQGPTHRGGQQIRRGGRVVATFPETTKVFVPYKEYYHVQKIQRPKSQFVADENFTRAHLGHQRIKGNLPREYQYLFFPPPKEGQKMDKLADDFKQYADPKQQQRVLMWDAKRNRFDSPPSGWNDPIAESEARRRKSKRGVLGAQPSPLMKYAVIARGRRHATRGPSPPRSQSQPSIVATAPSTPSTSGSETESPRAEPSRTRSGGLFARAANYFRRRKSDEPQKPKSKFYVDLPRAESPPLAETKSPASPKRSLSAPEIFVTAPSPRREPSPTPGPSREPLGSPSPPSRARLTVPKPERRRKKKTKSATFYAYDDQEAGSGPESGSESD